MMKMSMIFILLTIIAFSRVSGVDDFPKPGTPGKPRSMNGSGSDSYQIYLKRSEVTKDSKHGVRGHYFATFHILNGVTWKDYNMQVSAFTSFIGIVSSLCVINCNVDEKFDVTDHISMIKTQREFKNFDANTLGSDNEGGFKTSTFLGQNSK